MREGLLRAMEEDSSLSFWERPEIVDPPARLRERTVTDEGMAWFPSAEPERGDALGGVFTGPGSLLRAVCTRASRFCILERKLRRCMIEDD